MFEPGTKVICIDGTFKSKGIFKKKPKKGVVYTVRDIVAGKSANGAGHHIPAVLLEEILNPPCKNGLEPGFLYNRFADIETYIESLENDTSGST